MKITVKYVVHTLIIFILSMYVWSTLELKYSYHLSVMDIFMITLFIAVLVETLDALLYLLLNRDKMKKDKF